MKNNFLVLTFLLALHWQAQAQLSTTDGSLTFPRMRWDVGTDLLWLINKNTLPATLVFVRYNVQPKNHLPGAIRLRLGLDWSTSDSAKFVGVYHSDRVKKFTPFLRVGYEWQVQKGRHQFFYGADWHFAYSGYRFEGTILDPNYGEIPSYYITKSWETGPVGFAGIKFFLSSHLTFSMETSYTTFHRWATKEQLTYFELAKSTPPSRVEVKVNEWKGKFNPLYVFNISYHFL
jgi:hypothetical protein